MKIRDRPQWPPIIAEDVEPLSYMTDTAYKDTRTCEEQLIHDEQLAGLRTAVLSLSFRERIIIKDRFGLNGRGKITRADMARKLSTTKERVRQIEARALRNLRVHPAIRERT